ncbi:MAG: hypothetical protein D6733_06250, partial [Methanobacteriota archaeon]
MSRRTLTTVLVVLVLTSAGGCIALKSSSKQEKVSGTGTVRYIGLEGGFYGIVSDDGKNYDPLNLPEEFKKDGLKVSFEAEKSNAYTTHMWGTAIDIKEIKKLEESDISCPRIERPSPLFESQCKSRGGTIQPNRDSNGCIVSYECEMEGQRGEVSLSLL